MEKSSKPDNDCKIDDVLLWQNFIKPFHSLSSESRNSKIFKHSDFKMALGFAIKDSIAATPIKFINNTGT